MRKFTAIFLAAVMAFSIPGPTVFAAPSELHFTILHTNDEHSALSPLPLVDYRPGQNNPALGGFARLAQAVNDIRAAKRASNEPVLLLSAGDSFGGSPFGWLVLDGQAPELTLMNKIGYDAVTVGNHDFDYGPERMAQYYRAAGYPEGDGALLLASNTLPPTGHALSEVGIRQSAVFTLENGLRIGLFGLIGIDAISVAPYAEPVEFADQVETAQAMVASLKAEGVDVIVALSHSGEDEDAELARVVPGIDVIVGGHTHVFLDEPLIEGETIIVQAGANLRYLGNLELAYDPLTRKLRLRNPETSQPYGIPLDDSVSEHVEIAALVAQYSSSLSALVADMSDGRFTDIAQTVAWSRFPLPNTPELEETPFANFVTDAMRLAAEKATGERVDLAIQANGVIRGGLVPGSRPWSQDQVCFYDLANLVGLGSGPDGNPGYPLVSVYLTGQELRRIFEIQVLLAVLKGDTYFLQFSGARMTFDRDRAVLFTLPFVDLPIPTTLAVSKAELYTGAGIQRDERYVKLKKNDRRLYHVVSDYYLTAFLPMAGELLPSLELVLKDKQGNPIADIDEAIIYRDGRELKVWQAVLEHAAAQPQDSEGNPWIDEYYAAPAGRLTQYSIYPPLWKGLVLLLLLLLVAIIFFVRWLRKRRRPLAPVAD